MVQTASNLRASKLVVGVSPRMASEELAHRIGEAARRLLLPDSLFALSHQMSLFVAGLLAVRIPAPPALIPALLASSVEPGCPPFVASGRQPLGCAFQYSYFSAFTPSNFSALVVSNLPRVQLC